MRDERPPVDGGFPGNGLNAGPPAVERFVPADVIRRDPAPALVGICG